MHPSVLEWVAKTLTDRDVTGRHVLEVGACDVNGSVRPHVESLKPVEYLGVDASPGPRVDKVADCEHLIEQIGGGWDLVISTEMLEHVADWQQCVKQLVGATRLGGLLLITTRSPGFPYHPFPEDHWRFTIETFEAMCDAMNLKVLALEHDPEAPGVFLLARKPWYWIYDADLSDIPVEAMTIP